MPRASARGLKKLKIEKGFSLYKETGKNGIFVLVNLNQLITGKFEWQEEYFTLNIWAEAQEFWELGCHDLKIVAMTIIMKQ